MLQELLKLLFYSIIIVLISKYILVTLLRKIAETFNLKAKTVGNISGIATSVPELLTISITSLNGLASASLYNVISSNIINFIQYILSILYSKNTRVLKKSPIKIDLFLVAITILIPLFMLHLKVELNMIWVCVFFILFIIFYRINNNSHKLYLRQEEKQAYSEIEKEIKKMKYKKRKILLYTVAILITGILLFIVSNKLGETLEVLCYTFGLAENVVGIFLGFVTSIPELITFFEAQKHHKKESNEDLGVIEATNNLLLSNMLNLYIIQSIGIILYSLVV